MKWLLLIAVIVLLLGPLRPWFGRHWAVIVSLTAGALFGLTAGMIYVHHSGSPAWLALLTTSIFASAALYYGPPWLRKIQKDGKS